MQNELLHEIELTYSQLVDYLQEKYGLPEGDYFTSEDCIVKNSKLSRTKEGLVIHHVLEDKYDNAGNPMLAKIYPFECQKKENLLFCNYMEHMILHLKIMQMMRDYHEYPCDVAMWSEFSGHSLIFNEINSFYKNTGSHVKWKNNCYLAIQNMETDYYRIIKGIICWIEKSYIGQRNAQLKEGAFLYSRSIKVNIDDIGNMKRPTERYIIKKKITAIDAKNGSIEFMYEDGAIKKQSLNRLESLYLYDNAISKVKDFYCKTSENDELSELRDYLLNDYTDDDYYLADIIGKSF